MIRSIPFSDDHNRESTERTSKWKSASIASRFSHCIRTSTDMFPKSLAKAN